MKKKSTFRERSFLSLLVMLLILGSAFSAKASNVTISVPTTFTTLDASDGTTDGKFTVTGNLTITNGGRITCNSPGPNVSACPIIILVSGDMEIQAGGAIYTESHFPNGNGGNDSIVVGGTFIMRGPAGSTPGAVISSGSFVATSGNGNAGFIKIYAGGDITLQPNSTVSAYSNKFTAGAIEIIGNQNVDIDGFVLSESTGGGTGTNQGHGGTITITSLQDLLISDAGWVSSKGLDPGADLVHLAACNVTIYGLVQSTGVGHAIPNNPPNHLDGTNRPDKPANSTAGVEVWATTALLIDNLNHNGEIKADLCCGGGTSGESWIDLLAKGDITIIGNNITTDNFAVHANGYAGNTDNGGTITIKSSEGMVTLGGRATQANGTSIGGKTTVEAKKDVDISGAKMETKGSGGGTGGTINLRSFGDVSTGSIVSNSSSILDVTGHNPGNGHINFKACVAPSYSGTKIPSSIVPVFATSCGGSPSLESYVIFFDCEPVTFPNCPTCNDPLTQVVVDQNVTINFNTNPPTYTGDPDLLPFFTVDKSGGSTADKWFAVFNVGANKLLITNGATITVTKVGSGSNLYAPGLQFISTCGLQMDNGTHIVVASNNKNAGDINILIDGDIMINGEVRNEVTGTNGMPGAIYIKSECGQLYVGPNGRVFDLGIDGGGNLISLLTCGGDITIDTGLVKAYAHAHADNLDNTRPRIKVVSSGKVTVNANTAEPLYDEFSQGGGLYDLWGGLLSWVRDNNKPGKVEVQAAGDITVRGHGDDPTPPVRTSFGAIAAKATASSSPGGLVDVRSLGGSIFGYDRAFDVSGKNLLTFGNFANIKLSADGNIWLSRLGANATFNPVVDASSPGSGGKGGRNDLRAYQGMINVGSGALVSASVPAGSGSVQGTNWFTYCTFTNNGTVTPAPTTATNCVGDPTALYDCDGQVFVPLAPATSGIINTPAPSNGILIYPNPAKESFTLQINNAINQGSILTLQDLTGKEILHTVLQLQEGVNNYPVSVSGFSEGVYIVRLQTGTEVRQAKLIINR